MDWKLFFSTFALIFFAEFGDKTQLAALASAAGGRSTLAVFLGASSALVFSTLLAVLVGGFLHNHVPPNIVKTIAAILFFIFGALLLWSVFSPAGAEAAVPAPASPAPSAAEWIAEHLPAQPAHLLNRLVLEAALEFEKSSATDYDRLALAARNEPLRALFLALAADERSHLGRVEELMLAHAEPLPEAGAALRPFPRPDWERENLLADESRFLAAAIAHEKATAEFYGALAGCALLPAVKAPLVALANEEWEHVLRLEEASGSKPA